MVTLLLCRAPYTTQISLPGVMMHRNVLLQLIALILMSVPTTSVKAQYTNVRVSTPDVTSPNEVTIAINPVKTSNLIAGSNLRFFYHSSDAGLSWSQDLLPPGTWGDPCVAFDVNGIGFYSHLANLASGYFIDRLIVHRSTDGGAIWSDSVEVGYRPPKQQDKEWLAVDMTNSPYRNTIYMGWTEFDVYGSTDPMDSSRILFSRSTDAGATWSDALVISDVGGNCFDDDSTTEGAVPAVGPEGEAYVAWGGPHGIMFDRSTDGGQTFGNDVFVTTQPGGWAFDIPGIYRANGLPVTVCDIGSSPHRGTVYVLWSDQRNGLDNTDVFLIKSTDRGDTWGPVRKVNTDLSATHQFFPAIDIDPSTGNIYVVYYDRRNTIGNETEVYLSRSTDGGETFSDEKISESPFDPMSSIFFGDYIDIAALNGMVHPIWMRLDGTVRSIWTTTITDTVTVGVPPIARQPVTFRLEQNYPNPFNPATMIRYAIGTRMHVHLAVYDQLGRLVSILVDREVDAGQHDVIFENPGLATGIYYYRLDAGVFSETRRLMVLK
jgi:hypothetical protein